jgi:hypothetical protein
MNSNQNQSGLQVLKVTNKIIEICCQYGKNIKLNVPIIKVVGSQSAGKSTLIKRMIEYDILPMGENMVTRTPVYVRMHNSGCGENDKTVSIVLSYLNNENIEEVTRSTFQEDSQDGIIKQNEFKQSIMTLTDQITNGKYTISKIPIFIDIYSAKVINFSFVDLPGLVISASIDKGQPVDLRNQIDNLVKNELSQPNTIAMVIVKSGIDFVTDLGVGLINEIRHNTNNIINTIGVLTKPDLLDAKLKTDLNYTIAGKITNSNEELSTSESMSEGYFVVNGIIDNCNLENKYFHDNFDNSREIITEKRYGVKNLREHLQGFLINAVTKIMPDIKHSLSDILKTQKQKLQNLGCELESTQDKINYVISTISELSRLVRDALKDDNTSPQNIGPKIKIAQNLFLKKINNLQPFSRENMTDNEIQSIINEFNGFHMTARVTIEQLVDKCVNNPLNSPTKIIYEISEEFVGSVVDTLSDTINQILTKSQSLSSLTFYPQFKTKLQLTVLKNLKKYENDTNKFINKILLNEIGFFWTTDEKFNKVLITNYLPKQLTDTDFGYEPNQIRELATEYYITIIRRLRDLIIKIIVKEIINELSHNITNQLNVLINPINNSEADTVLKLIVEETTATKERQILKNNIYKIDSLIKMVINYV